MRLSILTFSQTLSKLFSKDSILLNRKIKPMTQKTCPSVPIHRCKSRSYSKTRGGKLCNKNSRVRPKLQIMHGVKICKSRQFWLFFLETRTNLITEISPEIPCSCATSIHYGTQLMPSVVFLPKNWGHRHVCLQNQFFLFYQLGQLKIS